MCVCERNHVPQTTYFIQILFNTDRTGHDCPQEQDSSVQVAAKETSDLSHDSPCDTGFQGIPLGALVTAGALMPFSLAPRRPQQGEELILLSRLRTMFQSRRVKF